MALVNDAKKEIHAKIVYFGPGESGKTTNLEYIYNKLKPEYRGKFKFMNTSSGRLVFFDFMRPELAGIGDYSVRFHIYTAPGNNVNSGVWKNALKGADGIVFVADASPSRYQLNKDSQDMLKECLSSLDMMPGTLPCLFQFNKTDLSDAVSEDQMRVLLDTGDERVISTSAATGSGVLTTLSEMVKQVIRKLQESMEEKAEPAEDASAAEHSATTEPLEAPELAETPALHEAAGPEEDLELLSKETGEELPELEPLTEEDMLLTAAEMPAYIAFHAPEELPAEELPAEELPAEELEEVCAVEPPAVQHIVQSGEAGVMPEPKIQVAGDIEKLGYGRFRLPLVIRFGNNEKKTALTLDLSFD